MVDEAPDPGGFRALWDSLLPIGLHPGSGGYRRYAWTDADAACRSWFLTQAADLGLRTETDRNGNLWAWWDQPGADAAADAVVTGSHLDSVPDGGGYDGPLGVVSGLAALRLLRERGVRPRRPLAVAVFSDEEGARFGLACVGSRLATGALDPAAARDLRDAAGVTLAAAMARAGHDPDGIGPEPERLDRIGAFVELHVEQGRTLADLGEPVAVGTAIWPHGRWRFDLTGAADHAGTTRLPDRRDPMLPFARLVTAARDLAAAAGGGAVATVGRVQVEPNGTNAVPAAVHAWLDARAEDADTVHRLVEGVHAAARAAAGPHRVDVALRRESWTPEVTFDPALRDRLARLLAAEGSGRAPLLPTGAGHDAGILAAAVPTGMLYVRNPTGVSHSPREQADEADCVAGVYALAAVLEELACR